MSETVEDRICKQYKRMTGVEPIGLRDTLHILTSPDMIALMRDYVEANDR